MSTTSTTTKTADVKKADAEKVDEVVSEGMPLEDAVNTALETAAETTAAPKNLSDAVPATTTKKAPQGARSSRKRIPLGTRNVLTAPKRPGYSRRFVNDKGDRIQVFKDAGWEAVETDDQSGDDRAGRATSMGSSANPSVGGGQRAVLMEIPTKFFDEDNKSKQAKIAKVENEIKRNSTTPGRDGLDGKISIS